MKDLVIFRLGTQFVMFAINESDAKEAVWIAPRTSRDFPSL